ncbi:MAG: threonine--tRNA ligase [Patescibacteria group bacterium]|nr:threonine--tRNA ligase [Patescibacteria group bacterium]MDD5490290.1 threonine--tRNA ligase [Patescibacteria group bacterium]
MNKDTEILRHSLAHLMAAAVQELYPEAKFGIGPVIENGFYYDFDLPEKLTPEDLLKIEKRVGELIKKDVVFTREEMDVASAIKLFKKLGQDYKVELLKDIKEKGTTKIKGDEFEEISGFKPEAVSVYSTGNFIDLCRGPHVASAKELSKMGFKLLKLAGAYWRGSEKNKMLQRIYGLAFASKKDLEEHLKMLEEAEKRDHRKIGAEQELFFIDDLVGKGLVMWQPNGVIIRNEIEKLVVEMERRAGYVRVVTPHMAKEELYLTSGHLPYYKESMYPAMVMDDGTYYLKAMNCPHHHLIFRHKSRSYRDLPMRLAEYGTCYRNELSGTLAGLLRVRGLAMNDAHIYCRRDQIKEEFKNVMELTMGYFKIFNHKDYWFRLSKWSPEHLDKYINEPDNWGYSQNVIREVLEEMGVKYVEAENEAAFYGPKVDVQFKSIIGREETMSTIQLDFVAKTRFNLNYIDETGRENNEVFVIHRAPLSTHERFLAFLIEHYGGVWPVWLSPAQVVILTVGEKHADFAGKLVEGLRAENIRAELDVSDETVGNKIRKAEKQKIPYMLVIGDKEMSSPNLQVRVRGEKEVVEMPKKEFIEKIKKEIAERK